MRKYLKLALIISLLLAGGIHVTLRLGPTKDTQKEINSLKFLLPQAHSFSRNTAAPPCYEGYDINARGEKKLAGVCFLTTDVAPEVRGYAGPVKVMVGMDTKGVITGIEIISHHETPSYAQGIEEPWFKGQFKGKRAADPFEVEGDIDGISRATVTVTAIAQGVKKSAMRVGRERLGLDIPELDESPWLQVDYLTLALLCGLLGLVIMSFRLKVQKWRMPTLIATIALVGFYHTNALSSVNVVNILTYRLPALPQNLFWYLLVGFTLFCGLMWGRVYCGFICPFGAVLELLERIGVYRLKLNQRLDRLARYIKYGILWLVLIAALVLNDANISDYEPFSILFTLIGDKPGWMLLALAISGSLFIPRFFCRYLCGIGLSLGLISKYSLKPLRIKQNCKKCINCQDACPYGAIEAQPNGELKIDQVECIQCHICLNNCPQDNIGR